MNWYSVSSDGVSHSKKKNWLGLLFSVHKDDREQLLRMLVDCCYDILDDGAIKTIIDKISESSVSVLFLFCLVLQNQKLIDRIKNPVKDENIKLVVLCLTL